MTFDPAHFFTPDNIPPSAKHLGAEFLSYDINTGRIKFAWTPRPEFTNPMGNIQGGFITAMLDDTFGPLVPLKTLGKYYPQSVDIHTHYLRPVPCEPLTTTAQLIKIGRRMAFAKASLFDAKGRECATASSSLIIGQMPKQYEQQLQKTKGKK